MSAPTVLRTLREAPLGVKAILAGVFVNRLSGFMNIFLVLFLTSRGYSPAEASLALGVYGAGALLGVFLGGSLADRLGARNATVLSMTGTAVLTATLLYLPSYPLLLLASALASVCAQLYRPASAALLSELVPADRQIMIFAMHRFGLNLGAMAAPLLGFALYSHGYALLFWGEAAVALGYAVLAWVALPARASHMAHNEASSGGYRIMLRDRRFVGYLIAAVLHTAVYAQYLSTLPLDVTAAGVATFWYTLAVSLNGFIVIAFELVLTRLTQSWPVRLTIGLAFALLGAGVALYGLPLTPAVILIGTVVWSLGEIIGGPAIFAYPAIAAPDGQKGRYIAGFQFCFGLGSALGPMVGGLLFIQFGHLAWPLLALGSAVATAIALCVVSSPSARPAEPVPQPA
jgi:MFS family permease